MNMEIIKRNPLIIGINHIINVCHRGHGNWCESTIALIFTGRNRSWIHD